MCWNAGRERFEIDATACQDSRPGSAKRAGAAKGLVSITGCFDLRGARGGRGRGRAGFVTTVGSRMEGFRSFNCLVLRMGFNSMDSLGFCLFSAFTGSRFIIHFIIEPDFGSGLCVFMCVLSAPAFPQRLKHRGQANCWVNIYAHKKEQHLAQWKFFQIYYNIM